MDKGTNIGARPREAERPQESGTAVPGRGGRMSRQRKTAAVLRLLRGEDREMVSRSLGVTAATLTHRHDAFFAAGEAALTTKTTTGKELENDRLKARFGAALIEREEDRPFGDLPPFSPAEAQTVSLATTPVTGKPHGLAAVLSRLAACPVRGLSPSGTAPGRRGPTGPMSDDRLTTVIRGVLAASPFHGEGHRKVRARLRHAGTGRRRGAQAVQLEKPHFTRCV